MSIFYSFGTGALKGIEEQNERRYKMIEDMVPLMQQTYLTAEATKSIASFKTGADVFRFLDLGTKALEIESGVASNEPVNYAVRSAIEYCVYLLLAQGDKKGYWSID